MFRHVRTAVIGAVMALGLATVPAQASTFQIEFFQTGLGDAGADWFGTFEAPAAGGLLTSFSALIDGTAYSFPQANSFPMFFNTSPTHIGPVGSSFFSELQIPPNAASAAIFLSSDNEWGRGSCNAVFCNGGTSGGGTYSISSVPLPATLPLFVTGLAGLALAGYRRKKKPVPQA